MTLEEKLEELRVLLHKLQFDYYDHGANMHTIVPDSDIKNIMKFVETLCQQEIAEACKERDRRFQIYANAINQIDDFFEYRYRNYGGERTKEFVMDVIGGIIKKLNAPKESE